MNESFDVALYDPYEDIRVKFIFKAEVQGQNRRPVTNLTYDRDKLIQTLVYHWPTKNSGCWCGWNELGKLFPAHVADIYEQMLRED